MSLSKKLMDFPPWRMKGLSNLSGVHWRTFLSSIFQFQKIQYQQIAAHPCVGGENDPQGDPDHCASAPCAIPGDIGDIRHIQPTNI